MKKSKRYIANLEQIDKNKTYTIEEAIELAKKAYTKDGTEENITFEYDSELESISLSKFATCLTAWTPLSVLPDPCKEIFLLWIFFCFLKLNETFLYINN